MFLPKFPIVLVAFGTTRRAKKVYQYMDAILKEYFPDHELYWAYSSRMIRSMLKQQGTSSFKSPLQILSQLKAKGHKWAVVQSLHLLSGHEFFRLKDEISLSGLRTSIGLPLLSYPSDYFKLASILQPYLTKIRDKEAVILVGHGTDHPIWSSYIALEAILREKYGNRVFIGVIEGYPSIEHILSKLLSHGISKVKLMPLMLVSGNHVEEDLMGNEDSWKRIMEKNDILVEMVGDGLGYEREIVGLFADHIKEALSVIPYSVTR